MSRPSITAALIAATLAVAPAARAERAGLSAVGEGRAIAGTGSVSDLTLALGGAGADLAVSPSLTVRGVLLAMVPIGEVDGGDVAPAGGGGELSLRLTPWPAWPARPYLRWGLGLMLFTAPFLPGGTRYDGISTIGAGVEVGLGERWAIGLDVTSVHLSNGQGIGEHNPAYDGFGIAIAASRALAPRPAVDLEPDPGVEPRSRRLPGAIAGLSIGAVDGELIAAGRARVIQRIAGPLLAQLDLEAGSLAGEAFVEIGGDVAAHLGRVSIAPHLGYRRFAGVDTAVLGLQAELHVREVSAVAMVHHERSAGFGDLTRAGAGLRAYPLPSLFVELGVGFDRLGDDSIDDGSDPFFGAEWQLPVDAGGVALSLALESQISTIHLVAVRGRWGAGETLRDGRGQAWRRLR